MMQLLKRLSKLLLLLLHPALRGKSKVFSFILPLRGYNSVCFTPLFRAFALLYGDIDVMC